MRALAAPCACGSVLLRRTLILHGLSAMSLSASSSARPVAVDAHASSARLTIAEPLALDSGVELAPYTIAYKTTAGSMPSAPTLSWCATP